MLIANAQLITPSNTFDFDSRAIFSSINNLYTAFQRRTPWHRGRGGSAESKRGVYDICR